MAHKDEKILEVSKNLAAEFISRESNRQSLVTVTGTQTSTDGKTITMLVSVLPVEKEKAALDFLKRKRGEFRSYVLDHSRIGRVPTYDFELDVGEKNRQRIDEIVHETERGQE